MSPPIMDELWWRPLEINVNQIEINLQIFFDLLENPLYICKSYQKFKFSKILTSIGGPELDCIRNGCGADGSNRSKIG